MKRLIDNELYCHDLRLAYRNLDLSFLRNKTVLITGGLGLIGSCLTDLLHLSNETGLDVQIIIADINDSVFAQKYQSCDDIQFVHYDASIPFSPSFSFDYCVACAGLASPELYTTRPVETITTNVVGILNLLEYCRSHPIKRFLYISSSEVYGNKQSIEPFCEETFGVVDINTVRSSYSEAKRLSEVLCKAFASEYGVDTIVARPGHIFGPGASPKDKRVSSVFFYQAAQGHTLELKSSGMQKRSYTYSVDCARQLILLLAKGVAGESYNIGCESVTSIREFVTLLANRAGVAFSIGLPEAEECLAFNPMNNSSLDISRIRSLGYCDLFSVETGIDHTFSCIKDLWFSDPLE